MTTIESDIDNAVESPRASKNAAGWLWVPLGAAVVALLVVGAAYGLVRIAQWSEQYRPPVVTALEADGSFVLSVDMASIQGDDLILQESGNQTFIKWADVYGNASWRFFVPSRGTYDIALTFACAEGAQGSDLLIEVAGEELEAATTSTGDWDTWETRTLSQLPLGRGVHKVHVRAASMAGDEVMRLKAIAITPVSAMDATDPPDPRDVSVAPEIEAESEAETDPTPEAESLDALKTEIETEISEPRPEPVDPAPEVPGGLKDLESEVPEVSQPPASDEAPGEPTNSSKIEPIESTPPTAP